MVTIINMEGEKVKIKANKKSITVDYRNQKVQIPFGVDRFKYLLEKFEPNEYDVIGVKIREVAHLNDLDEKRDKIIEKIKKHLPEGVSVDISCSKGRGLKIIFFYKSKKGGCGIATLHTYERLTEKELIEFVELIKKDLSQ